MNRAAGVLLVVSILSTLSACSSRLPGATECERMAQRLVGIEVSTKNAEPDRKRRRLTEIVIHGCLTSPFDYETVQCVEDTRLLSPCVEALSRRAPERKPALKAFMARTRRHQ